ncbi:hypothetical protein D3C84_815200 [compost metagenome]
MLGQGFENIHQPQGVDPQALEALVEVDLLRLEAGDGADFRTQPLPVAECICLFDFCGGFDDRRRRQYGRVRMNRLQHGNTLVDGSIGPIGINAFKDLLMGIEIMRSDRFGLFQKSQQYRLFGDIGFAQ